MDVPSSSFTLMIKVYKQIFPAVNDELNYWKEKAEKIPNDELRSQALSSISSKRFHCQGGAVYSLLAGSNRTEAIRFIVAYQTISDYLDNLCDRSTSMDPNDFRLLHQAMLDALCPSNPVRNYYAYRDEQDDGGYLIELIQACQDILKQTKLYPIIRDYLLHLEGMYADLQVHKHVHEEKRIPRLTEWFEANKGKTPTLTWYEFSAATGSTLGIFCMVSYALGGRISSEFAEMIYNGYFPYVQGLHILLDYYIDQEEDKREGDLNFCSYYPNKETMQERLNYFIEQTDDHLKQLPDSTFHKMIHHGLVGLYLGDPKVGRLDDGEQVTKFLLKMSGIKARFFYWNTKMYYKLSNKTS